MCLTCGKMALKIGDIFPLIFTPKSGYQVIAPILPKYDGQIIEIEKDKNCNMCSWCTFTLFFRFINYHKITLNIPFKLFFGL